MNNIFFTSDTHFFHEKVLRYRPFRDMNDMNESLISRWNSKVSDSDCVYHLGDVSFGRPEDAKKILNRLNGNIYLIRGNHEQVAENAICRSRFAWIKDYHRIKVGEQKIYLLHYAMRVWNCSHHGSWHLYGHSHGSLPEIPTSKSFDVGVDCWNYYPISFDEVKAKMDTKIYVPIDHHIPN